MPRKIAPPAEYPEGWRMSFNEAGAEMPRKILSLYDGARVFALLQ